MNKVTFFKKIFLLSSFIFFALFLLFLKAEALLVPQVYPTNLSLSKTTFSPQETIEGSVSLKNFEDHYVNDLTFHFQLFKKGPEGLPTELLDSKTGKEVFSLGPSQEITKSFSYQLPTNLPQGKLIFRVQLATSRGEELTWIDQEIAVESEGKFLILKNYWILGKNQEKFHPGGGVYYQPGETPKIIFDVSNQTSFTITAYPKIITYKRNEGGKIIKIQEEKEITFNPSSQKTLTYSLPSITIPDTYLSKVTLFEKATNQPISNSIYFRWIVSSPDDAEILFVKTDKNFYQANEKAIIEVIYTGPADHRVEGGKAQLQIKMFDQKGNLVGEAQKEIELKSGTEIVEVLIQKKVENPKIEVAIVKNGKVLDSHKIETKAKVSLKEKEERKPSFFEKNKNIILPLAVTLILLVGLIIFLILK
ncbi:hypothetical protein J7K91_01685 [bacterium]|nr:hypothetical protein [bacterium]